MVELCEGRVGVLREKAAEREVDVVVDGVDALLFLERLDQDELLKDLDGVVGEDLREGREHRVRVVDPVLPLLRVLGDRLEHGLQAGVDLRQVLQVLPGLLRQADVRGQGRDLDLVQLEVGVERPPEEELPLLLADVAERLLDLDRQVELEDPLVDVEDALADVQVDGFRDGLYEVGDSERDVRVLHGALDPLLEQPDEVLQRELVHVVDDGQVLDHEEQQHGALRHVPVHEPRLVDVLLLQLALDEALVADQVAVFDGLQALDELVVVQQLVEVGHLQQLHDALLVFLELLLRLRDLQVEQPLLLLDFGHLVLHHVPQQLLLQPLLRDLEVYHARLDVDARQEVRVRVVADEEQLEPVRHLQLLVADVHHHALALLAHVARQQVVQRAVDVFLDVVDQDRLVVTNARLDAQQQLVRLRLQDFQALLVHVENPLHGLVLRVDEQRVLQAALHYDAVADRNLVLRQLLLQPLADLTGREGRRSQHKLRPSAARQRGQADSAARQTARVAGKAYLYLVPERLHQRELVETRNPELRRLLEALVNDLLPLRVRARERQQKQGGRGGAESRPLQAGGGEAEAERRRRRAGLVPGSGEGAYLMTV